MEQVPHTVSQARENLVCRSQQLVDYFQMTSQRTAEGLRVYINMYPPLAAFLFTLLAFSAVPVSIYVLFAAVTVVVTLSTALIGFAIIEGTMLFAGAGILLAVLGVVSCLTGVVFCWLFGIYLCYRGCCMLYSNVSGGAWSLTEFVRGIAEKAQQRVSSGLGQVQQTAGQTSQP